MIIRQAKQEDESAIIALGKAMYVESTWINLEFDESKCRESFYNVLFTGLALVAEEDGAIIGMFGGEIQQHIFSNDLMSMDVLHYVIPEFRGSSAAKRMITVYKAWAAAKGVKTENVYLGIMSGINVERTEKFYNKLGFERAGVILRQGE
jgi:N-acetylglutamate synthase-like GNAT family acetyltransferase